MVHFVRTVLLLTVLSFWGINATVSRCAPKEQEVLGAMKKASDFMMNTVSNRGGFLWSYSADLSEQWGEVPARKSQIWVQPPGTTSAGMMFLETYQVTGDPLYLKYAGKVARALIWGQHPSGGWHYFIDFDMPGVQKWYDEVASRCWGWEEYYHYYGNCTYDDDVTTSATRFLLELYMTTLDPEYRGPLLRAMDFILKSQYPNGGWPQRYPLKYDYPHDGHPDYTSYYTFNDGVISNNIYLLLEAYDKLGNEEYKKAALRGMDFILIAQMPAPQAGWGAQHGMDLKPAAARSYEPAAVSPGYTVQCIRDLETFYMITGNRKYLRGIPDAIAWLENSILPEGHNKINPSVTHSIFYELGTNKPLYAHREGTNIETGRYWIDYEPKDFLMHYGAQTRIDIPAVKKEFERVNALSPADAMAEYQLKEKAQQPVPKVDPEKVEVLIKSMDEKGAWITEISIPYYLDLIHHPPRVIQGIETRTYLRNMYTLIHYLQNIKK